MSSLGTMSVFQDLTITPGPFELTSLREALLKFSYQTWQHAEQQEKQLKSSLPSEDDVIVFQKIGNHGKPVANLVLWKDSIGYKVSNIVPTETSQLDVNEYNSILADFVKSVARPALEKAHFQISTTKAAETIDDWVSSDVATKLKRFSALANKSSAATHPLDEARWLDFIMAAHRRHSILSPSQLIRWLTEIDAWPEENASKLAIQYEEARSILTRYDAELANAD